MRRPFHSTCVDWPHDVDWLIHLQGQAEEIKRARFLRLVDAQDMASAERGLGYVGPRQRGMKMAEDPYVRYYLEPETKIPFFVHSAIEFVFATPDDIEVLGRSCEAARDADATCGPGVC